jgi:hypothetical protein
MCSRTPSPSSLLRVMTSPSKFAERIERAAADVAAATGQKGGGGLGRRRRGWDCRSTSGGIQRGGGFPPTAGTTRVLALDIRRYAIGLAVIETVPSSSSAAAAAGTDSSAFLHRPPSLTPRQWDWRKPLTTGQEESSSTILGSHHSPAGGEIPPPFVVREGAVVIPTHGRRLAPGAVERISRTAMDHAVGGYLVGWPLEPDTGKAGARCGRVLYVLQALHDASSLLPSSSTTSSSSSPASGQPLWGPLFSPGRPICLWDVHHTVEEGARLDGWGRSPQFARTSPRRLYRASRERYYRYEAPPGGGPLPHASTAMTKKGMRMDEAPSGTTSNGRFASSSSWTSGTDLPIRLWTDFCQVHWPASLAIETESVASSSSSSWGGCGGARGERRDGVHDRYRRWWLPPSRSDGGDGHEDAVAPSPPPVVKHLFVDRQLRLAAAVA